MKDHIVENFNFLQFFAKLINRLPNYLKAGLITVEDLQKAGITSELWEGMPENNLNFDYWYNLDNFQYEHPCLEYDMNENMRAYQFFLKDTPVKYWKRQWLYLKSKLFDMLVTDMYDVDIYRYLHAHRSQAQERKPIFSVKETLK